MDKKDSEGNRKITKPKQYNSAQAKDGKWQNNFGIKVKLE